MDADPSYTFNNISVILKNDKEKNNMEKLKNKIEQKIQFFYNFTKSYVRFDKNEKNKKTDFSASRLSNKSVKYYVNDDDSNIYGHYDEQNNNDNHDNYEYNKNDHRNNDDNDYNRSKCNNNNIQDDHIHSKSTIDEYNDKKNVVIRNIDNMNNNENHEENNDINYSHDDANNNIINMNDNINDNEDLNIDYSTYKNTKNNLQNIYMNSTNLNKTIMNEKIYNENIIQSMLLHV
jgi:hypothetical protein